jgi:chemotaxis protein CheD
MENEIIVKMGAYAVCKKGPVLTCLGIGSCIATILFDRVNQVYGMSHSMLPLMPPNRQTENPNRYADVCINNMLEDMIKLGAKKINIFAKIAGGAHMFSTLSSTTLTINIQNIEAVKKVLLNLNIKLLAEDTGGIVGRTIHFSTLNERVEILMRSAGILKEL